MFKTSGLSRDVMREELESFASQVLRPEMWALADRLEDVIQHQLHGTQARMSDTMQPENCRQKRNSSLSSAPVQPLQRRGSARMKDDDFSWLGRPRRSYVPLDDRKKEEMKQRLLAQSEGGGLGDSGGWTPMFPVDAKPAEERTKSREPLLGESEWNGDAESLGQKAQGDDADFTGRASLSSENSPSIDAGNEPAKEVQKEVKIREQRESFASVYSVDDSADGSEPYDRSSAIEVHTPVPWRRRMTTRLSGELFEMPQQRSSVVLTPIMQIVMDIRFTYVVGSFIVLNAGSMGWQADYMALHWKEETPRFFLLLDVLFCIVFTVELSLRILVYGCNFFTMMGWQWNVFDVGMVIFQLADVTCACIANLQGTSEEGLEEVGVLRMMRIFRLFRVLRLVRLMSVFSELRMFIVSIADSMRSLFWTIVLILLAMYIGGIYLTQLVTDHKIAHPHSLLEHPDLERFYGSLGRSMLTLYETISEGVPWSEVMVPLAKHCSPWMALVFSLWMAFTMFAMLNVITGVFVESALQTANDDKKKLLMYQMRQWFAEADVDKTDTLTWDEFTRHLENPKMERFLKIVDLDTQEAWELFHLLDVHGKGEIHADDFVNGCVRVTGTAKAIDLVTLMHYYKVTMEKLGDHSEFVETVLIRLDQEMVKSQAALDVENIKRWSGDSVGGMPVFAPMLSDKVRY